MLFRNSIIYKYYLKHFNQWKKIKYIRLKCISDGGSKIKTDSIFDIFSQDFYRGLSIDTIFEINCISTTLL